MKSSDPPENDYLCCNWVSFYTEAIYMTTKKLKVLEYAMQMEKQGMDFYTNNMTQVSDPNAKKIFESLAKVEKEHYNLLRQLHSKLSEKKSTVELDLEEGIKIFEKELKDSNIKLEDMNGGDLAIMRMAYLIENDFADFYKKAAENATNTEVKELLLNLAEWENTHRKIFYKEFKDLMEENWFKQTFYPF